MTANARLKKLDLQAIFPGCRPTASSARPALRAQSVADGMKPLRIAGAMKVLEGVTTADEVLKVTAALT